MVKVGFIGVGGMGMGQARAFSKTNGAQVVACSDVSEPSRAGFSKEFPNAKAYSDHKQLLADKNVDAVVIATPTLLHKDVAIDAMNAGRPVLTEKPLARTVADCHKMIEVSQKTGKLLMVAHCRRFDPDWGTMAKLVTSGEIGSPVLWRHCNAGKFSLWSPSKWFLDDKLGGGPLIDGAVHNYDFANMIFGDPESVISSSIKLDPNVTAIDTGTAVVRYKSGSQLMVSWSWSVSGGGMHDLIGPKGSISFGPGDLATPDLDQKTYGYYRVADDSNKEKKLVKFERGDMYVNQAQHFVDCVTGKTKTCLAPATESIKAIAVAEAILTAGPKGGELKVKW